MGLMNTVERLRARVARRYNALLPAPRRRSRVRASGPPAFLSRSLALIFITIAEYV
jgi:hypothetical protein